MIELDRAAAGKLAVDLDGLGLEPDLAVLAPEAGSEVSLAVSAYESWTRPIGSVPTNSRGGSALAVD